MNIQQASVFHHQYQQPPALLQFSMSVWHQSFCDLFSWIVINHITELPTKTHRPEPKTYDTEVDAKIETDDHWNYYDLIMDALLINLLK